MAASIFILKHYDEDGDSDIDRLKVYTNVDKALDTLREWLEDDGDLMNYAISKYEFNATESEYEHVDELDLDELIEVEEGKSEDEEDSESDLSYITSSSSGDGDGDGDSE